MSLDGRSLPGRLGDHNMKPSTDPRIDANLSKALQRYGVDDIPLLDLPSFDAEQISPLIAKMHDALDGLYQTVALDPPSDADEPRIIRSQETIKAIDGTDLQLYFFRREDTRSAKPAVVYYHGGGMSHGSTLAPVHLRWCTSLAVTGLMIVLVDFRNAWTAEAHNPFPTGQLDCTAALKYVHANKDRFKISKIVLQGESGGANMALSVALRAKREGFLDHIDGVFACIPYISNGMMWSDERKLKELPSLVECDGYMLEQGSVRAIGWWYGPNDLENPQAWPYYASIEDMKGLPPHMLVMDELDPFRDEGIAYHRKLAAAGVQSTGRVNLGTTHGGAFIFNAAVPQMYNALIRDIAGFANSL